MTLKSLFGILIIGLATAVAQADPGCNSFEQCRVVQAQAAARSLEFLRDTTLKNLGDVARRSDRGCPSYRAGSNEICTMNQSQAQRYCADRGNGSRLPTALELGVVMNPAGVSLSFRPGDGVVYARNGVVDFYYNEETYSAVEFAKTPAARGFSLQELKTHCFWSSSAYSPNGPMVIYADDAYALCGVKGHFVLFFRTRNDFFAVRCVR